MKPKIQLLDPVHLDPDQYYSNPIISNSGLGAFWAKLSDSSGMSAKPETLIFGQNMHLGIYEPEKLIHQDTKEFRKCLRMVEAGRKTPVLSGFLKNKETVYEKPYYALIDGVPVKVKPDAFIPKSRLGHDAKSTATNSLEAFLESMKKYGYWRQAALYMDATGGRNWYFTAISKTEPHKTFIVDCKQYKAEVKQGRIEYREFLRLFVKYNPNYLKEAFNYLKI